MTRPVWYLIPLLLAAPTCASAPVQFAVADGTFVIGGDLPPFPTWAPTKQGPVPIKLVRGLTCNGDAAHGCYVFKTREILIEEALPHVLRWRILRHELVHAAVHATGVKLADSTEQAVADAMADQGIAEMLSGWPR